MRENTKQIHKTGFTLIELMIVVVILGLLATIIMPRILNRPEQARRVKAKIDIRNIESALALFKTDTGRFPTTSEGLEVLVSDPGIKGYNSDGYLDKASIRSGRSIRRGTPSIRSGLGITSRSWWRA